MIKISINRMKINPDHVKKGKDGAVYLDAVLLANKGGVDKFGNDGFIVQDISKEAREAGDKGPIIGNWRDLKRAAKPESTAMERGDW